MTRYPAVGANIDTWLINVKGKRSDELADELDFLKEASQEADGGIPTRWTFAGESPFIRAVVVSGPILPAYRHQTNTEFGVTRKISSSSYGVASLVSTRPLPATGPAR